MNDAYYLNIADSVARRGTCDRAAVGCVIVLPLVGEIGRGRNTAPNGVPTCAEAEHLMHDGHCCRATHAEINALADAARREINPSGATAYITHYPCIGCAHALLAANIARVVYRHAYRTSEVTAYLFDAAGVSFEEWSD